MDQFPIFDGGTDKLDPETGLVALSEDYFWRVRRHDSSSYDYRIGVVHRRRFLFWTRVIEDQDYWYLFDAGQSVRAASASAMSFGRSRIRERTAAEAFVSPVGEYPPKKFTP